MPRIHTTTVTEVSSDGHAISTDVVESFTTYGFHELGINAKSDAVKLFRISHYKLPEDWKEAPINKFIKEMGWMGVRIERDDITLIHSREDSDTCKIGLFRGEFTTETERPTHVTEEFNEVKAESFLEIYDWLHRIASGYRILLDIDYDDEEDPKSMDVTILECEKLDDRTAMVSFNQSIAEIKMSTPVETLGYWLADLINQEHDRLCRTGYLMDVLISDENSHLRFMRDGTLYEG